MYLLGKRFLLYYTRSRQLVEADVPQRPTETPSAAGPHRHFDGPAGIARAVLYGGVRGGEETHGFDLGSTHSVQCTWRAIGRPIDHDPRKYGSTAKSAASAVVL